MFLSSKTQTRSTPIIGWLTAALVACTLQGCGAVRMAYNNSAELSYWWLDNYLDFNDAQSVLVRTELARLLAWHRSHELTRTSVLFKRLQRVAAGHVTARQVCALYDDVREVVEPTVAQAEPAAMQLLASLSDAQFAHLQARLDRNNEEYRREWGEPRAARQRERRLKAQAERFENLYGPLEDAQMDILKSHIASSEFDFDKSYALRVQRQKDMIALLRQMAAGKGTPGQLPSLLQGLFPSASESAKGDYMHRLRTEGCATFADVHNAASPEQRQRAVKRLEAYERDARELSAPR